MMATIYPKWVKSKSGITVIQLNDPFTCTIVRTAKELAHSCYQYEKIRLEKVETYSKNPDYLPATKQEFIEACTKYLAFSEKLKASLQKVTL